MTEPRGVIESLMVAAMLFVAGLFWHLWNRQLATDPARSAPPIPAPMAGGVPVLVLGQNAVAPDRRWLLLPPGA